MALSYVARLWPINLPEGTIYNWDQLCAIFIDNLSSTYKRASTAKTLKTIKQKPNESVWNYMKYFRNTKNAIPNIQDIEIINVFRDGVTKIKIVEEIIMKKSKIMAGLLTVADECIKASKA
jgi:hypothetical protein